MGFFDDLVAPAQPRPAEPDLRELGPEPTSAQGARPPTWWRLPATLAPGVPLGAGPHTRVLLARISVWPACLSLHVAVFRRRYQHNAGPRGFGQADPNALRVGLELADGRRVTTLDGEPWPASPHGAQRVTLRQIAWGGGGFYDEVELLLSELPPPGPLALVVEWPDERVPETRVSLDAGAIRAAAARSVQIWPELAEPQASEAPPRSGVKVFTARFGAGHSIIATTPTSPLPGQHAGAPPEQAPRPEARADWSGIGFGDWGRLDLVRARLTAGADPTAPTGPFDGSALHEAAADGTAETMTELLRHVANPDLPDQRGHTPLWHAVCHGNAGTARALLGAGANPWPTPGEEPTPGALALRTPLADLVRDLPGAVARTEAEIAAQREADTLIAVFNGLHTEGLGVAFVAGLDEEEVIRRLGADPAACPVLDLMAAPGPHGTGPGGFDPDDFQTSLGFVGVTGVPGGVVLSQPTGYLPSDERLLSRISAGVRAYGLFFNSKGGTFGALALDGRVEQEEIGLPPSPDAPSGHWLFRFWQRGEARAWGAELAYACASAGMRLADATPITDPPRRWAPLPKDLLC